jgi:hypothetical protein
MISSAPYDPQNSHHFVVSSFHFAALWTVLGMALWRELLMALVKELLKELLTELEMALCLLTFWTSLSMPHRHCLLSVARVPVWVLASAPPRALSVSPSQVDKSTSACRSRSQHLADRPILAASIACLAPSAPLFGARVSSDQSRAGAVSSPLSLYQQSSWWSIAGKHLPRR